MPSIFPMASKSIRTSPRRKKKQIIFILLSICFFNLKHDHFIVRPNMVISSSFHEDFKANVLIIFDIPNQNTKINSIIS